MINEEELCNELEKLELYYFIDAVRRDNFHVFNKDFSVHVKLSSSIVLNCNSVSEAIKYIMSKKNNNWKEELKKKMKNNV